jgi:undecaprenyl diphosphate synthase
MKNSLQHIAIIPDGNRRWAKERNLPAIAGHKKGYERVKELVECAREVGVSYVTFWAFSTENWKRSDEEVQALLHIIHEGLSTLYKEIQKEKTRFVHIGRKDRLGDQLRILIQTMEKETRHFEGFCLVLGIDYGGEDELIRAVNTLESAHDSTKTVVDFLDTSISGIPCPDIIVRTSGEVRTSGFMPLQSAYAEWFFENAYFPDFDKKKLLSVIDNYKERQRRFGA